MKQQSIPPKKVLPTRKKCATMCRTRPLTVTATPQTNPPRVQTETLAALAADIIRRGIARGELYTDAHGVIHARQP